MAEKSAALRTCQPVEFAGDLPSRINCCGTSLEVCCLAAQLCLNLCNPMDCRLPGSSVHGIFQARIVEQKKKNIEAACQLLLQGNLWTQE